MTDETTIDAGTYDEWDRSGDGHYLILPERRISDFFTEERDMLSIDFEHGKWWLNEDGAQGADPFDTLAAAKAAGDERCEEILAGRDERLLAEAGLDPAAWKVEPADDVDGGLAFDDQLGRTITGRARSTGPRWTGYDSAGTTIVEHDGPTALAQVVLGMAAHLASLAGAAQAAARSAAR